MDIQSLKAKYPYINFESDGCSIIPDRWFTRVCCIEHDFYYRNQHLVGIYDRAEADRRLRDCLINNGAGKIRAWLYWTAVRCFGGFAWRSASTNVPVKLPEHWMCPKDVDWYRRYLQEVNNVLNSDGGD